MQVLIEESCKNMSKTYAVAISLSLLVGCSTVVKTKHNDVPIYPSPEVYLLGRSVEDVAKVYGQPEKTSTVGGTNFVKYSRVGTNGYGFSNICFLEIQSNTNDGRVTSASLGSNLYIDSKSFPINVRQECNKLFYRAQLTDQSPDEPSPKKK
jgi:hypothetical protein